MQKTGKEKGSSGSHFDNLIYQAKSRLRNKDISKVKNDHRSKFSNLSNWKDEVWKNQGSMLYQLSYEATHCSVHYWMV